jgi:MFS family permease
MGVNEELKRFQNVWGLLLVAAGMLQLVNSLEGAFARTLVSCADVAPDPLPAGGLWSGSEKCGNRTVVINQGSKLSSAGQSQESIIKLIMMASAAVCSDIYGRKPVLIAGLACTTFSVFLFVIATFTESWARTLFVLAQALQGAYSPTLLTGLFAADLAQRSDTDTVGVYAAEAYVGLQATTIFGLIAFAMQMCDFANYFPVWLAVLAVNASTLCFAIKHCPETRVKKSDDPNVGQGVIAGTVAQLTTYKNMFFDDWSLRMLLFTFLLDRMGTAIEYVSMPMLLAYHEMSQARAILFFFPVGFIGAACVGFMDSLTRKHGMKRAFVIGICIQFAMAFLTPLQPTYWWAMYVQTYVIRGLMSGWNGFVSAMDNQGFGDRVAKFICIRALLGHSVGIVSAPLYAWLFEAGAVTYVAKALPSLCSLGFSALHAAVIFLPASGILKLCMERLDGLAKERAAQKESEENSKLMQAPESESSKDSPSTACPSNTSSRNNLYELEEEEEKENAKKTQ